MAFLLTNSQSHVIPHTHPTSDINWLTELIQANAVVVSATAPENPTAGKLWYNTTKGVFNIYNWSSWILVWPEVTPITKAQYDALSNEDKNDWRFYLITDNDGTIIVDWANVENKPTIPTSLWELSGTSDNITEWSSHLFMTPAERTNLWNQSWVNTGDQSASDFDIKDLADTTNLRSTWSWKQDAISDLATIRSWASAWATAVQPNDNVSTLTNDAWYITNAVSDLTNYYTKTQTYTKAEVDNLLSDFGWFEVVEQLPAVATANPHIIYLLWPIGTWGDRYEEWIVTESTLYTNETLDANNPTVNITTPYTLAAADCSATYDHWDVHSIVLISGWNGLWTYVGNNKFVIPGPEIVLSPTIEVPAWELSTSWFDSYTSITLPVPSSTTKTWTKIWETSVDLSNYFNTFTDTADSINAWTNNLFVTSSEKSTWNAKQDALVSGTNIKTVNGNSLLWSWDVVIPLGKNDIVRSTLPPQDTTVLWYDTANFVLNYYNDDAWKPLWVVNGWSVEPSYNITGNLWYDINNNVLKVYRVWTWWKDLAYWTSASTAPSTASAWHIWYDTADNVLKVYDWTNWIVTGKTYTAWDGINIDTSNNNEISVDLNDIVWDWLYVDWNLNLSLDKNNIIGDWLEIDSNNKLKVDPYDFVSTSNWLTIDSNWDVDISTSTIAMNLDWDWLSVNGSTNKLDVYPMEFVNTLHWLTVDNNWDIDIDSSTLATNLEWDWLSYNSSTNKLDVYPMEFVNTSNWLTIDSNWDIDIDTSSLTTNLAWHWLSVNGSTNKLDVYPIDIAWDWLTANGNVLDVYPMAFVETSNWLTINSNEKVDIDTATLATNLAGNWLYYDSVNNNISIDATEVATQVDLASKQDKASSWSGTPTTTPSYIGEMYVDTTIDTLYVATWTSSSNDWIVVDTNTEYTAWDWIDITSNEISIDATVVATKTDLSSKQDTISDLATIRSWASAWATAIQPNDNVSELTNDAWYITSSALDGYSTTTEMNNAISTATSWLATESYVDTALSSKQDTLTAWANITIAQDWTISATDTTYTAWDWIDIASNEISVDVTDIIGNWLSEDANNNIIVDSTIVALKSDLSNYYTKTETYTKTEVDNLIASVWSFEVVATLPSADTADAKKIYLLWPIWTGADKYEEYIVTETTTTVWDPATNSNVEVTTKSWTKIWETSIDLSGYATTTALTNWLATKQDTLTASDGIDIDWSNNISVDVTDIIGTWLSEDANNNIIVDTTVVATQTDLSWKQDKATSWSVAPSATPSYVWQQYIDTTNDKMYVATGTSSSSDWMEVWAWWSWSWDMQYSDFNWVTKTWASITLDLNSYIAPSADFTVNAPATIKDWQVYVLRVASWLVPYTMTLGTNITNPYSEDLTLTSNTLSNFSFIATGGNLELQPSIDITWVVTWSYEAAESWTDLSLVTTWEKYIWWNKETKPTSWSWAPSIVPAYVWQRYFRTSNSTWYVANGTTSSSDWIEVWNWIWDMLYADFNWATKTWETITLDLNSTITPSANFTVNAPATIKDGQVYILRVVNWATAYTMTLGTWITNPYSTSTTLTANWVDQFVFQAIGWDLELLPDSDVDISGKQDKATTGSTTPSTAPSYVGQQYVNTTSTVPYIATWTTSTDWQALPILSKQTWALSNVKIWVWTQAAYEALSTKDANTLYFTTGS